MPNAASAISADTSAPPTATVATTTGDALADAVKVVAPEAAPTAAPVEPEASAAEKASTERESARFAALAKRERSIVEAQKRGKAELEAERAKIAAEREQHAKDLEDYRAFRATQDAAKRDPGGYLRRLLGDTWYEQLTEYKLGGEKPSAIAEVEAVRAEVKTELEALRKQQAEERAAAEKAAQDRQAAEAQATIERFHADTVSYVKGKGEEYELTNALAQHALVYETIEQAYERTGKLLSVPEAAAAVEKHLEEQVMKGASGSKMRARLSPSPAPVPGAQSATPRAAATLTNGVAGAPSVPVSRLTEDERIARAMARLSELTGQR